ncbi:hypothetical protein [Nocardioides sp. SYSU DS0651]|uniref:hypothetical protein n=1 Tax=Nocardioides sp. SYSU DS0651 TaxID=3415955 RepID=UPI003F4B4F7B
MADSAPVEHDPQQGFLARNNEVVGSVLSLVGLAVAIALGALIMLGTGTRGISAILTVVLIAGGTFTLLLLAIAACLKAVTPADAWDRQELEWREGMGFDAPTPESEARSRRHRSLVAAAAVVAILVGLSLSVLPASL